MRLHEFLAGVQQRAGMVSLEAALRATNATLETLAERLEPTPAGELAAHLPAELARSLEEKGRQPAERFSADEFFGRVSAREGVELTAALVHARAVVEQLGEVVPAAPLAQVQARLPADFARLFQPLAQGELFSH